MISKKHPSQRFCTAILYSLLLLYACGPQYSEDADYSLTGYISIDGSSTVYPITEAVAEEYRYFAPNVRPTIGVSGTGGGFKKFSRGEIDINNASRSIKESEVADAKANNIEFLQLSVAYDGLTVVVHPENNWVQEITVAELKKMWEPAAQGKIKRWNQIRPEWPDQELHLYGAGVESGTYDYFTEAIVGESHASRGDFTASEDDNVLVQGVATDKYALGFFGFAYFEENKDKLRAVPVNDEDDGNGAGAIMPTLETVKDGTYAPLSRALFIYINSTAVQKQHVVDFIRFYFENVPVLSQEVGFIPLPADKYKEETDKFERFVKENNAKAVAVKNNRP